MNRTKAYQRFVRQKHISRKKRICRAIYGASIGGEKNPGAYYKYDGQYNKGKIYCDCRACRDSRRYGNTVKDLREKSVFQEALMDYENES